MLELRNITYYYAEGKDKKVILEDINFFIKPREFVSLVGPSGCGKTTLVNIIAGHLKPIGGEIFIKGEKIEKPGRNRIVISQEEDLFNWLTVQGNMKIVSSDFEKINNLLEVTSLVDFKDYYPGQLSGGMKKRLALARALAADSEFIIMDEPFGSQDYKIKSILYKELLEIAKDAEKTVLLITHDLEEALLLSDRIIILKGTPARIEHEFKVNFSLSQEKKIQDTKEFIDLKNQLKLLGYNI